MARLLCVFLFMSIFKFSQCQVELTGSEIAFEGEEYVLTCHIAANEGTRYFWFRDGIIVARSDSDSSTNGRFCGVANNTGFQSDRYELNCKQHQLIIKSIDSSDDGVIWRCHNFKYSIEDYPEYGGTFTMKTGIPVTDINMSFMSFITYRLVNNTLQIQNGSILLIDCQPNNDASPAPTIRLYKNGVDMQRTTGHHLKTYLTVTMEMNGLELQCVANNSKQFKRSPVIKLSVPDSTTMSLRVNNVTDKNIILQCEVDGRPNNYTFSPWKHYVDGVLIRDVKGYLENEDKYIYYLNISTQLYKNRGVYVCSGSYSSNGKMYTHTANTTIYLTASREPQRPEINIELISGVIVSIVIILLVSFIIFMVVRKKQQMTSNQESLTYSGLQIGRGEGRLESDYDDLATYVNQGVTITSRNDPPVLGVNVQHPSHDQGVAITSSNDPPVLGVNVQHPSDDQGVADTSRDGPPVPLAANASSDDLPVYIEVLNNPTYDDLI